MPWIFPLGPKCSRVLCLDGCLGSRLSSVENGSFLYSDGACKCRVYCVLVVFVVCIWLCCMTYVDLQSAVWCFREIIDVTENNDRSVCVMKIVNLCTVHILIICFEWQKLILIDILSTFLLFPSPTLYFLLLSFTGRWRDQIKGFVFSEAVAKMVLSRLWVFFSQ